MSELKIASARRQLGTALALYLQDFDPVSVHCLAGGGCELIEYYAKKAGGEPFTSHALKTFPGIEMRQIRTLQRKFWNAFKHAIDQHSKEERDDDRLLMRFTDEQNDHALFIGWYDYGIAVDRMPIEAQIHQAWYIALHPEKLAEHVSPKLYDDIFPGLLGKPRSEQKQMLNQVIERYRADQSLMNDPRTEPTALILGWEP
jgi:hypothetical protein